MRRLAVLLGVFLVVTGLGALVAPAASAHPLGNFTVNQYSGLVVRPDGLRVDYVLDLAELPTFQYRTTEIDADHDGAVAPAELAAWSRRTCGTVAAGIDVRADGRGRPVSVSRSAGELRPGTAGLPTLRVECTFAAPGALDGVRRVEYRSGAFADRVGWREVTAAGDRMTVRADVPTGSVSHRLTAYPADLLTSPLDVRAATLAVRAGGPPLAGGPADLPATASSRGVDALTRAFTDFVGRPRLGVGVGMVAVLLSVLLGAAHAFAPGHGKTVMAAYLVGERGAFRQAATVAGTVTVTHTAGVLVLGAVLTTAVALAPTQLYAWLGVASGLMLAGVGATLLGRALRGRQVFAAAHKHGPAHADGNPHGHAHPHPHPHAHPYPHPHAHPHPHPHAHPHGPAEPHAHPHPHGPAEPRSPEHPPAAAPPIRRAGLLVLGFAGGLVPSPSAVVVLLGAVALGRTWFGIVLVAGYGLGMAITLAGLGYVLARWGRALDRRGGPVPRLRRALPLATASLVVCVGLVIAAQAGVVLASGS
ncbi:MAG: nickel/cobalt transporter (NicO) family protein [Actinomycetota bacterium]|nr:nickel/cobalt transporter (NicO) family protein [Actinomycetota bacterium]